MVGNKSKLDFKAEVKKTSSKKTASLDVVYQVVLETSDAAVLSLGALDGDTLLNVTVEPEEQS